MKLSFQEEITSLLTRANEFQRVVVKVKRQTEDVISRSEKLLSGITGLLESARSSKSKEPCTVCFTNDACIALSPCGHIFCCSCSDRLKATHGLRCFTCRTPVNEFLKIFR